MCLHARSDQVEYEDDFSSVGLGVDDIDSTCSGIRDIVFTGEVRPSP